jgi:hypothetical protein
MYLNVCFVNMASHQTQQSSEMDDGTRDESENVEWQPAKGVNPERMSTCLFSYLSIYLFVKTTNFSNQSSRPRLRC